MCDRIFVRNSQRIRISGGSRLNHFAYVRMECNAARLRYILPTVVIIYHYYCCYYLRWIRVRELQRPAKKCIVGHQHVNGSGKFVFFISSFIGLGRFSALNQTTQRRRCLVAFLGESHLFLRIHVFLLEICVTCDRCF